MAFCNGCSSSGDELRNDAVQQGNRQQKYHKNERVVVRKRRPARSLRSASSRLPVFLLFHGHPNLPSRESKISAPQNCMRFEPFPAFSFRFRLFFKRNSCSKPPFFARRTLQSMRVRAILTIQTNRMYIRTLCAGALPGRSAEGIGCKFRTNPVTVKRTNGQACHCRTFGGKTPK